MTVKGRYRYLSKLILTLTFLLLAACGGGGSDPGTKPELTVPNVVNVSQANAEAAITAANLNVGTITGLNSETIVVGNVITQDPLAESIVNTGSVVNLTVSLGPVASAVNVPDVVAMTQVNAEAAIVAASLLVGTISNVNSDSVLIGNVVSQDPTANSKLSIGTSVNLEISIGPLVNAITVPLVVAFNQVRAETSIISANLTVGTITEMNSNTFSRGTVISQEPIAGTDVSGGSAVNLVISLGPAANTTVVPALVGWDKASARNKLFASNLNFNFITVSNSAVPTGNVISHIPVANTIVTNGSVVNLLVSLGPSVSTDTTLLFGTITHDVSRRILLDSKSENLIILGHTSGNLNGKTNNGLKDIFVSMYDVALNHKWTTLLGTSADDIGYGLAIAPSGDIYITGTTQGNLGGKINNGQDDAFIAKLDSSGNTLWVELFGSAIMELSRGIGLDSKGNIYISGSSFVNLNGVPDAGTNDIFLAKFSSAGVALWSKKFGGKFSDSIRDMTIDAKDNIYICGWYSATDIDGNIAAGGADIFLAKYDVNGTRLWSRLLGSASNDFCHEVSVDGVGNVYVSADTSGDLAKNVNQGDRDIVLAKYDSAGNQAWVKLLGSSMEERGRAIGIAPDNSIFVSGNTFGSLSGMTNKGMGDVFLAHYDANGNLLKTTLFGTSAADQSNAIVIDSNGTKYMTGKTRGDFGSGIATGGNDIFIRKSP